MFTAVREFFTPPSYEDDPERTQDTRTTHRVAVVLLGLSLFSIPLIFRLQPPIRDFALYGTLAGLFMWLVSIALVKRGRTDSAKLIILSINTINLFVSVCLSFSPTQPCFSPGEAR